VDVFGAKLFKKPDFVASALNRVFSPYSDRACHNTMKLRVLTLTSAVDTSWDHSLRSLFFFFFFFAQSSSVYGFPFSQSFFGVVCRA